MGNTLKKEKYFNGNRWVEVQPYLDERGNKIIPIVEDPIEENENINDIEYPNIENDEEVYN